MKSLVMELWRCAKRDVLNTKSVSNRVMSRRYSCCLPHHISRCFCLFFFHWIRCFLSANHEANQTVLLLAQLAAHNLYVRDCCWRINFKRKSKSEWAWKWEIKWMETLCRTPLDQIEIYCYSINHNLSKKIIHWDFNDNKSYFFPYCDRIFHGAFTLFISIIVFFSLWLKKRMNNNSMENLSLFCLPLPSVSCVCTCVWVDPKLEIDYCHVGCVWKALNKISIQQCCHYQCHQQYVQYQYQMMIKSM